MEQSANSIYFLNFIYDSILFLCSTPGSLCLFHALHLQSVKETRMQKLQ